MGPCVQHGAGLSSTSLNGIAFKDLLRTSIIGTGFLPGAPQFLAGVHPEIYRG